MTRVRNKSKEYRTRIPTGAAKADIKRLLRNVKKNIEAVYVYKWVEFHQDRYTLWHQLSLEQQLNVLCDKLEKQVVGASVTSDHR